ncbi:YkgJ family cysteine cluster protein [Candidatus Micrarchaeota archaeon]|nr:YkgJ family cysteine cluster protein [Candidatus Micrarchaeota archaeon]
MKTIRWINPDREKLNRELRSVDCRKCGKCCDSLKHLAIKPMEERIFRSFILSGRAKIVLIQGFKYIEFGEKGCPYFSKDEGCAIYEMRPAVCRMFPVGIVIDKDEEAFFALRKGCPEINKLRFLYVGVLLDEAKSAGFTVSSVEWIEKNEDAQFYFTVDDEKVLPIL